MRPKPGKELCRARGNDSSQPGMGHRLGTPNPQDLGRSKDPLRQPSQASTLTQPDANSPTPVGTMFHRHRPVRLPNFLQNVVGKDQVAPRSSSSLFWSL
jgi:hypothetical protein